MACAACAHPTTKGTTDVRVVNFPERPEVTCWLPEIPEAPRLRDLDFEDLDVMSRVMIHRVDYADMVQWSMEMQSWAEEAQRCFNRLTGVEE